MNSRCVKSLRAPRSWRKSAINCTRVAARFVADMVVHFENWMPQTDNEEFRIGTLTKSAAYDWIDRFT
jgi:hypothetical protein